MRLDYDLDFLSSDTGDLDGSARRPVGSQPIAANE